MENRERPGPSGSPGPKLIPYNKNGVKWAAIGFMPETFDKVPGFKMSEEDIVVATYPKAGTTWMQEIVYLIRNGADLEEAKQRTLEDRYVFLEIGFPGRKTEMERLQDIPHPWLIKSHLPYPMLKRQVTEDKAKFIIVMRNPKDNLVSLYYFYKMNRGLGLYTGSWDQFFEEFIRPEQILNGNVIEFNKSWWEERHHDNVLVTFYEEMKREPRENIERVARFLGKELTSAQLDRITEATSFASMKKNPATNYSVRGKGEDKKPGDHPKPAGADNPKSSLKREGMKGDFMRKGTVGDWRTHFTQEQSDFIDAMIEKELGDTDLKFDYSL